MKVLVIGGGGREHALAWKLKQSAGVEEVLVAPGNAGTANEPGLRNVDVSADDSQGLLAMAQREGIGFTVVGPEVPLVAGLVDDFKAAGLTCFGPSKAAAQLEGSKAFSKDFLQRHKIPTAAYATFADEQAASDYVRAQGAPIVVKADGLAAGKGVVVAATEDEALAAVSDMLAGNAFGEAGHKVVIEEFLSGIELSCFVLTDGESFKILPMAKDYKRIGEGDTGLNTGGMGAYSPAPIVTQELNKKIMDEVMYPTVNGLIEEGHPYLGFLYAGLMIKDNEVKVLEFNCRFGDPETQPIMIRLKSSLVQLCLSALKNELDSHAIDWTNKHSCGVVIASNGYPEAYESNKEVSIQDYDDSDVKLFHAGTKIQDDKVVTSGGRVFCATALGTDLKDAQKKAYNLVDKINFEGAFCRKDIGYKGIK